MRPNTQIINIYIYICYGPGSKHTAQPPCQYADCPGSKHTAQALGQYTDCPISGQSVDYPPLNISCLVLTQNKKDARDGQDRQVTKK